MNHVEAPEIVAREYTAEFSFGARTQFVFFRSDSEEENVLHKLALDALASKVKTSVDAWRLERLTWGQSKGDAPSEAHAAGAEGFGRGSPLR